MKTNKISYSIFCIFFIVFIIFGCSKKPEFTQLTGVWKFEPSYRVGSGKILVVGKLLNESNRVPFEDYVVSELKIKNLDAYASYRAVPSGENIVKEKLKAAARVMGIQTVLVTKVVSVDQEDVSVKKSMSYDLYATTYHGAVMMGPYLEEPYVKTIVKARIETGIFDVESEKLIWAAKSRILDPGSIDSAIKDYTLVIVNQLRSDNIIP